MSFILCNGIYKSGDTKWNYCFQSELFLSHCATALAKAAYVSFEHHHYHQKEKKIITGWFGHHNVLAGMEPAAMASFLLRCAQPGMEEAAMASFLSQCALTGTETTVMISFPPQCALVGTEAAAMTPFVLIFLEIPRNQSLRNFRGFC